MVCDAFLRGLSSGDHCSELLIDPNTFLSCDMKCILTLVIAPRCAILETCSSILPRSYAKVECELSKVAYEYLN